MAATQDAAIAFEIVTDTAGLQALEQDWRALGAAVEGLQIFQDWDWQYRVWTCVAEPRGRRLRLLVGRVGGRVVLLWPLVQDGDFLRFLSSEQTEYHDIIVAPGPDHDAWLDAAWRQVKAMPGNCLVLSDVRADSHVAALVARQAPGCLRTGRQTWLIDLAAWGDWQGFAGRLSKQMKLDQKRRWKRAGELPGGLRWETVTDAADIAVTLDWFFAQKLGWMAHRNISTRTYGSPEYRAFIGAVTEDAAARGALLMARLMTGSDIVSTGFGYVHRKGFIAHSSAYDPAYHAYSPSRLLRERMLQWCFERGLGTFDFLPGDMAYKADWADSTLDVTDYMLATSTLGSVKLAWHTGGLTRLSRLDWLRHLYHRLPKPVHDRVRRAFLAELDYTAEVKREAK